MAIELKTGDYFLGCWTLHSPIRNWLAIIVKRDDRWLIQYRFRYFKDDKIGTDSKDERKFFAVSCDGDTPESKVIDNLRTIMATLKAAGFGSQEESVLMQTSDFEKAMELMNTLPSISSSVENMPASAENN